MEFFPDAEGDLEQHGLYALPIEFYANSKELGNDQAQLPGPTADQVRDYCSARSVLAAVAPGARFGSLASAVAVVGVYDNESLIAVAGSDGSVSGGQDAPGFFAGLAFALNAVLVVGNDIIITPDGHVHDYEPQTSSQMHTQTLSLVAGTQEATLYNALMLMPGVSRFGEVGDHTAILTASGLLPSPLMFDISPSNYPMITLEKAGELRSLHFYLSAAPEHHIVINAGPNHAPVCSAPPGTPAHAVTTSLGQIARVIHDPEAVSKPIKKASQNAQTSHKNLLSQARDLAEVEPARFFTSVGETLGLSPQTINLLQAFEDLAPGQFPPVVWQDPLADMSPVLDDPDSVAIDPFEPPELLDAPELDGYDFHAVTEHQDSVARSVLTSVTLEYLLKLIPEGDVAAASRFNRLRATMTWLWLKCLYAIVVGTVCVLVIFNKDFAQAFGAQPSTTYFAWPALAIMVVMLLVNLAMVIGYRPAKKIMLSMATKRAG